jgi:hypothetical protein
MIVIENFSLISQMLVSCVRMHENAQRLGRSFVLHKFLCEKRKLSLTAVLLEAKMNRDATFLLVFGVF